MMTQTDTDILIQCQNGDREAFRNVVQTYQRMVFSLALKMLASEADAEDVVQETFIRVWQGIGGYDVRRPFVTWLYTIASRLCLDRIKRNRRLVPMPDDEIVLHRFAAETDSQRELENHEWMAIVRMLAAELSPKQRLVFTLSQLEGLTTEEIEQIAGLSARQVKSNLYVARQTIRERLKILGYE